MELDQIPEVNLYLKPSGQRCFGHWQVLGISIGRGRVSTYTYCHGQDLTCTNRQALMFSSVSLAVYTRVNTEMAFLLIQDHSVF